LLYNNQMNEIWKPIVGFENQYEVSDQGNIRSLNRWVPAPWGKNLFIKGKQIALDKNESRRYYSVALYKNNKSKTRSVHRIVAIAFQPNPHNLPYVNHKDGVKTNNRASNLEWCTPLENSQHAQAMGLSPSAKPKNPPTPRPPVLGGKLQHALELHAQGFTRKQIAKELGFATETVGKHLKGLPGKSQAQGYHPGTRLSKETQDVITMLRLKETAYKDIAEAVGYSYQRVYKFLTALE
jgi:hypothetical protein